MLYIKQQYDVDMLTSILVKTPYHNIVICQHTTKLIDYHCLQVKDLKHKLYLTTTKPGEQFITKQQ